MVEKKNNVAKPKISKRLKIADKKRIEGKINILSLFMNDDNVSEKNNIIKNNIVNKKKKQSNNIKDINEIIKNENDKIKLKKVIKKTNDLQTKETETIKTTTLIEWTQKYTPKKIDELIKKNEIGKVTKRIINWLNNNEKNRRKNCHNSRTNKIIKKNKIKKPKTVKKKKITVEEINKICEEYKTNIEIFDENIEDNEENAIMKISDEISNKKNENKKSLLLLGNHGVGKTNTMITILNEMGYRIHNFDFNIMRNSKNVRDDLNKITHHNILDSMNGVHSKIVILIDKLESITSNIDKKILTTMIKINEKYNICPIILISNNKHRKILFDMRKLCYELVLNMPTNDDMIELFRDMCTKEEIIIKNVTEVEKMILDHCQNDFRRMLNMMYDITHALVGNKKEINVKILSEYCNISKDKDVDFILFDTSEDILYNYKGIEYILNQHEKEKTLLPLMMHEHYVNVLKNDDDKNDDGKNIDYEKINKISEYLSYGDIIENNIYGDQLWDIQELHGFYSCVQVSHLLNYQCEHKETRHKIGFITDLNKTSLKNINKKNITSVTNIDKLFVGMKMCDYMNMCHILQHLMNTNKIDELKKKIEGYKIKKVENIELLLKIDKINNEKINIKTKYKDQIKKILL